MLELKHSDGTPVFLKLYVQDDIEYQTPEDFDFPTEAEIERDIIAAQAIERWANEYEERTEPRRERWLNEDYHTLGST